MCHVLTERGFLFKYRDELNVKGVGKVRTYFLVGCSDEATKSAGIDRVLTKMGADIHMGSNGESQSLAHVVLGLVRSRQRSKRYGAAIAKSPTRSSTSEEDKLPSSQ